MQIPIQIDTASGKPLQRQLVDQIKQMVNEGVLEPGTKIPSSRALSTQLHVARNTVTLAYEHLMSEGYIESISASATFICKNLPKYYTQTEGAHREFLIEASDSRTTCADPEPDPLRLYRPPGSGHTLDFRVGKPDSSLFPRAVWRRIVNECLGAAEHALVDYADPAGQLPLRNAIADRLRVARGIRCSSDQIIIVAGSQEGLNLVGRLLGAHGSKVVLEDPCYCGAAQAMRSLGADLCHVRVDQHGIDVKKLPNKGVNFAIVTPSHQFPLGYTMPLDRRNQLLAWASAADAYIVEDDYDSDFRYQSSPIMALQAIDRSDRVIYIGTFSKCIGPALRLGYVVVPRKLAASARNLKATMNNGHPWFDQAVVSEFLKSGAFESHLTRIRKKYQERMNATTSYLKDIFPEIRFEGLDGGMHLTCYLPSDAPSAAELRTQLSAAGVGVYTVDDSPSYCSEPNDDDQRVLLLGYPSLTETQIGEAMRRMRQFANGSGEGDRKGGSAGRARSKRGFLQVMPES